MSEKNSIKNGISSILIPSIAEIKRMELIAVLASILGNDQTKKKEGEMK